MKMLRQYYQNQRRSKMAKPFKTVTTEYFEDFVVDPVDFVSEHPAQSTSLENTPQKTRRIRVVTTTTEYCGSYDDPAVIKVYSYL